MIDRKTVVIVVLLILVMFNIKRDRVVQTQERVEIYQLNRNINLIIINITIVKEVLLIGMINTNMKNHIIMINLNRNKNIKVINMIDLEQAEDIMKTMIIQKIEDIIKEVIIKSKIKDPVVIVLKNLKNIEEKDRNL